MTSSPTCRDIHAGKVGDREVETVGDGDSPTLDRRDCDVNKDAAIEEAHGRCNAAAEERAAEQQHGLDWLAELGELLRNPGGR